LKVKRVKVSILNPANALTLLRIALVPLYLWLFERLDGLSVTVALVVFVAAAVTDLIDGRLARQRKEVTKFGRFMDPLADKFLVIGALVQFWLLGLVNVWFVAVIVVRDVGVTAMRIRAIMTGTELKTSGDAKLKTTIQLTAIITIIVFTGGRLIAMSAGIGGAAVEIGRYIVFFNVLVSIAAAFTVYSWITYILSGLRRNK